jgi:hypothetical protein
MWRIEMKLAGIGIVLQLVALTVFAQADQASAPPPEIDLFSPQGEMRGVRQATARFSVPMVALGDPRLPDPFVVNCPSPGNGRWADGRNWVYDFDADLPAGLSCTFRLRDDVRTLAGAPLQGTGTFTFTTGGPAIVDSYPDEGWEEVDEEQIFLLKLAAPATPRSIEAHAHCVVSGIEEQIPLEVLTGNERAAVLKERSSLGYQYFRLLWKSGAVTNARLRKDEMDHAEERIAVVRCKRRLPPATQVRLQWGEGVATATGVPMRSSQTLAFKVRPAFTARVECTRANARAGCMPMQPVRVIFAAPVPRNLALGVRIRTQDGQLLSPIVQDKVAPTLEEITFASPFPEESMVAVEMPANLRDDAGRTLENAARFPLQLNIDAYPALAKFPAPFGILEVGEGGVLPVTVRNVEPEIGGAQTELPARSLRVGADPAAIAWWLEKVRGAEAGSGDWVENPEPRENGESQMIWRETTGAASVFTARDVTRSFTLTKPSGQQPAEVIGIALKQQGFYVVEIGSRLLGRSLLGRDEVRHVSTAALVTNLAVHFNWGREASSVWVTRLDNGQPVADAAVTIIDYCAGNKFAEARTDRDGIAKISASLGTPHDNSHCNRFSSSHSPLLVFAQQGEDFSFTQSGWNQGIAPHQFGLNTSSEWEAGIFHTVLDRALFRPNETVSMKHFLRRHDLTGVSLPRSPAGARKVQISHLGSGQQYGLQAQFDANGIAEGQWKIPAEAKLGDYSIAINEDSIFRQSGRFKVEQFRLPSMRASVIGSAKPLVQQQSAVLDLHVAYLSGGGASGLPAKLRTVVESRPLQYPEYADYRFGGAPVKEGIRTGDNSYFYSDEEEEAPTPAAKVQVLPVTLDGEGSARVTVSGLPHLDRPALLTAELEYADANGELLTATGRVRLVPSELSVGIRPEGWAASVEQLRFRVVVLGLDGKPRARQPVQVSLYQSTSYSYRKRLIGGFYAYETTRETKRLPASCSGVTNEQGLVMCEVAPGVSGEVLVRAEAADSQQRVSGSTSSFWVAGNDDWWFAGTQGDRMDVLPEKKEYEAGETARFQVRMPFREATALVTVAREGVLSSFTVTLKGQAPIIEVPIADAYAPNVFVSVLAVRGRVEHKKRRGARAGRDEVTALVDLNKPSYRLGMAKINVGWKPHRLNVRVTPDRTVYKVAEKAAVQVHVERANGQALPAGTEIAIAAVDEALLELAPNPSWDLLSAMMGERGVEVWTSTAQMQVVGKRHYGRKAVPHGGGGGRERDRAREQFDSLLLWQGRVKIDAQGNASLQVPLNDSLSSFRLVAVASGADDLFGTGTVSIATTQDLMLMSGLPPLVREGDRFAATFTLRNTTDQSLLVDAQAKVAELGKVSLPSQRVELPPGQARDVSWEVAVPTDVAALSWDVAARAGAAAVDRVKVKQTVIAAYPVRTYQATISQLIAPLSVPAERPAGAVKGRGGLEVTLRARLGDGLDGVREYMSWYPYTCLEQQLSRAVVLRDASLWQSWTQRLPAYMDSDGLLKYFPSETLQGEDTLTAYVLGLAHEAGWTLVEQDKERLIHALTRFIEGKIVRGSALPTADLAIRKLAAIEALSRYGVANARMLDSIDIQPDLWPTSAVLDWVNILKRVPDIGSASEQRERTLGILRARLNFQGTTLGFATEREDALWWLMISGDSNANRMLLSVLDEPQWRESIPLLVRGAMGRQQSARWNTTVANAWGVLALEKFSAAFESTPVTGVTEVRYADKQTNVTWPVTETGEVTRLPWQEGRSSLDVFHQGTGAPWAMIRATAALPLDKPVSSGYKTTRTVTPIEQQTPGRWSRGDVARVTLEVEAQSDMSWVVVDDPVPAGATILGSGLGGQSALMTRQERREGDAWLAFEERKFDSFRAYYRFVPKGRWTVEYTVRLNNPGQFHLPATRVEAMYAPEMFGELPNAVLVVEPRK